MRTETRTYNVYKVDELSFTAKENAYNRWLAGYEYPWQSENMATLKAFEGIFNIRVYDWRYDGCTCYYRFTSNYSEEEEELCGVRLLKFIVNNYWHSLFKPKTYWHGKDFNKQRRSRISVTEDCVLTGYCADMDILKPIYDFLKAPDKHTNLHDLMDECIGSFFRFCSRDVEDCTDEEAFEHDCEANGYEFLSDGTLFN
jgi:hypothetical protein